VGTKNVEKIIRTLMILILIILHTGDTTTEFIKFRVVAKIWPSLEPGNSQN